MIKTCNRAELVKVANDLVAPVVASLRGEVDALDRKMGLLRKEFHESVRSVTEANKECQTMIAQLRRHLTVFQKEVQVWTHLHDATRDSMKRTDDALKTIGALQDQFQRDHKRLSVQQDTILKLFAEKENHGE